MSTDLIEKLDKLALSTTMLDDEVADLQAVVEVSQIIDEIKGGIAGQGSPLLLPIFDGLSKLYEKYLLGDGDPKQGVVVHELTNDSITAARGSLTGDMEEDDVQAMANAVIASLQSDFDIAVEGAAPPAAESAGDADKVIELLDKLALAATQMDDSITDLQAIVEVSQAVDGIKDALGGVKPWELVSIFMGLSTLYETYMLGNGDPAKGPEVLALTDDSITVTRGSITGEMEAAEVLDQSLTILGSLKEKFDIELESSAPVKPESEEAPVEEEADKKGEFKEPDRTEIKLIDENDVVIYEGFLDESTDQVNKIEEYVMTLEETPSNMDIINSLFRVFHSLKGAAGFLGLNEINFLCHEAENLLDKARKSQLQIDGEFIDVVLASRDLLEKGLTSIDDVVRDGKTKIPNFSGLCEKLPVVQVIELINRKIFGYEVIGDDEDPKLGQILLEKKLVTADKLKEAINSKEKPLGEILVDMGAASKDDVNVALKEQKQKTYKSTAIKVDTQKLNVLLELVGELVIAQSIISQNRILESEQNLQLSKDIQEMAKITSGIQDLIMALRMVPLRQTFQKMNRLVRDLSRKTKKKVNFVIKGEDTEIDKTLVEKLNDPLIHLLRNAVDHGLESEEDRVASGKSPEGTILLYAYQKGGNVVIEIRDDGKGLNLEAIKKKAVEKGLIEEGKECTQDELIQLIFLPGFSTHKVATDLSGRGVGMDVVRRYMEELGGRVEITTEKGKGSTFFIKLPLTMAIVDGMLVKVGEERYIIPTVSISESLRPKQEQLTTVVNEGEVISVRGELISLIRLNKLLDIPNARTDITNSLVIIVGTEKERRGLLVDDLLGQQQVVIKNLDRRLHGIKGFSGSSILGDGLVGLIVDVSGIFEMAES